jgi:hypothetical protein
VAGVVSAVGYLLGDLLLGLALFRARILAKWPALLLAIGSVATALVPLLPHSLDRLLAFPVGVALIGLGHSLLREQRSAPESLSSLASSTPDTSILRH